jgi:hypothetical protein
VRYDCWANDDGARAQQVTQPLVVQLTLVRFPITSAQLLGAKDDADPIRRAPAKAMRHFISSAMVTVTLHELFNALSDLLEKGDKRNLGVVSDPIPYCNDVSQVTY